MTLIPSLQSGIYNLTISSVIVPTYCYLYNGAMWALVLKVDGSKTTFTFNSAYWTTQVGLNSANYAGGIDNNEYESSLFVYHFVVILYISVTVDYRYWQMPFTQMLFGMRFPTSSSNVQFAATGTVGSYSSLWSAIASGSQQSVSLLSRAAWAGLFAGSASLEPNCNFVCLYISGINWNVHIIFLPFFAEWVQLHRKWWLCSESQYAYRLYEVCRLIFLYKGTYFIINNSNNENDCCTVDSAVGFGV